MPSYSARSREKLAQCHPDLQRVFNEVIRTFDHVVLTGHRARHEQEAAVAAGRSKTPWPRSKHNTYPARAVDVAPYPLDWEDTARFYFFAGYVMATAREMGIALRWGGDWDRDTQVRDNTFNDLVHFELFD